MIEYKCERCRFKDDIDNRCKSLNSEYYNLDIDNIKDLLYEDCEAFYSNIDDENIQCYDPETDNLF